MKKSLKQEPSSPSEFTSLLKEAAEFHGHLGPFLTIGVRMGLLGLQKMGSRYRTRMTINASLPLHVPFSCIIDGLQVSTHCTVGNQKLSVQDANAIEARFTTGSKNPAVTITLRKAKLEEMKSQLLEEALPADEVRRLAHVIANIPDDELFSISCTSSP